jgi:hypothetical protein
LADVFTVFFVSIIVYIADLKVACAKIYRPFYILTIHFGAVTVFKRLFKVGTKGFIIFLLNHGFFRRYNYIAIHVPV